MLINLLVAAGAWIYIDKETGLYFLQSRYYDPEIGRFTTKDRFMGFDVVPASQNPYTYCENDPVNKVDPDGEFAQVIAAAIIGVLLIAYYVQSIYYYNSMTYSNPITTQYTWSKGGKQNHKDTGLSHVPTDEVKRLARDKTIPKSLKKRYIKEEKARKIRNARKR